MTLRIGLIGAGGNTKLRHIPGFNAIDGVEITAVCNRSAESTHAAADEFEIPRRFDRWQDLVSDHVDPTTTIPYYKGAWADIRRVRAQPELAERMSFLSMSVAQ